MKTLRFRIEPTSEQRKAIDHEIEANRLVYNCFVTVCKLFHQKNGKLPTVFDLNKLGTRFRHNCAFVSEAYSMTLNETAKRAISACEKTLGRHDKAHGMMDLEDGTVTEGGPRYPRYKNPGQFCSYAYPSCRDYAVIIGRNSKGCRKRMLRLGKVPGLLRCYNQRTRIKGDVKTCTVVRKDAGTHFEYYACVSYEPLPERPKEGKKKAVGVDIGISNIAALSDGTVFRGEYAYLQKEEELKRVQRKLSSLSALTEGYRKTKAVLNHIYEKIDNRRRNTTENISRYIADNYDTIAMEDLSVAQLRRRSRDRWMTKRYNDVKLGELRRRIQDKAESAGCSVILVDPRGTSQICSSCGAYVKKDLSVRVHVCPACGLTIDRDVNAARNILARALSQNPQGSAGDPRPGFVRAEKPAV